jgi:drug/metabolite transporter (DMT)-like permease
VSDSHRFSRTSWPALRGGGLALAAAVLFGASTPFVQKAGASVGPLTTASLLYIGAFLVGLFTWRGVDKEARLQRGDFPRLLAMATFGAMIGPVALAWGLQQTSGASASLMLTLEAVFTAVLAAWLYGETMDRRVWFAMALLTAGGVALIVDQHAASDSARTQLWGLLAVLLATAAWGMDNTLSRALADRDPGQVIGAKALLGSAATAGAAVLLHEPMPEAQVALALLAIGATGYGLSLRCYLLAQRAFGAARTGSVFAFAPFIGAVLAFALGERSGSWIMLLGSVLMLVGVSLHLMESHGHAHAHESMTHEHAHQHDDGHHTHTHDPMPEGAHSHSHEHHAMTHDHPHVPDLHHQHRH